MEPHENAPSGGGSTSTNNKLFIGGLSYETTDDSLAVYFSQFGQILSAVVLRDQESNRSRGFGFVTFVTHEAAQNALSHHHHIIDGRKVESKFAVPRRKADNGEVSGRNVDDTVGQDRVSPSLQTQIPQQTHQSQPKVAPSVTPTPTSARSSPTIFSPNTTTTSTTGGRSGESQSPTAALLGAGEIIANKIFVGGLRYATSNEVLRSFFEQFGEVETAQVIFNRDTKKSRGFGFVVFRDTLAVDKVLARQKISPPVIEGKQVEVKTCVARQDSSSGSGASVSPRAVPQTPIVTRSDSHSSLTSSSSVNRAVSATPVRAFQPPPQPVRENWGVGSPVGFESESHVNDRRPSITSARSASPFGTFGTLVGGDTSLDAFATGGYGPTSPFTSPQKNGPRESPSVLQFQSRLHPYPSTLAPPNVPQRSEPSLGGDRYGSFVQSTRESAFSVPESGGHQAAKGNPDVGLFDLSAFGSLSNIVPSLRMDQPQESMRSTFGRQINESPETTPPHQVPTMAGEINQSTFTGFKPLTTPSIGPSTQQPLSPAKPGVAKSPLLEASLNPGSSMSFSPYVGSPSGDLSKTIW